jgi:hypothetical protein
VVAHIHDESDRLARAKGMSNKTPLQRAQFVPMLDDF